MKAYKKILTLVVVLMVGVGLAGQAKAQDTQNFYFESFEANYYLDKNSADLAILSVNETLVAVFPDFNQNRGILRAIPEKYDSRSLNPAILSVKNVDGEPWQYDTYKENQNLVLKIGDPNVFVQGRQIYEIDYTMRDVARAYEGHDEFYWNINGTDFPQSFGLVRATINLPAEIASHYQHEAKCFTGRFGSLEENCRIGVAELGDGLAITVEAENLAGGENLSIVLAFDKGTFKESPWPARYWALNKILFILLPTTTFIVGFNRWHRYGRDPQGKGIIAQYEPPKGFNVLMAKTLIEEKFRPDFISAGIIELALQGYLKIHESITGKLRKKTEYELELVKIDGNLSEEQLELIKGIFSSSLNQGEKVNLSKSQNKLFETANSLRKSLPKKLTKLGYFKQEPSKAIAKHLAVSFALIGLAILTFIIQGERFWLAGLGLILSGVIFMIFSFLMPAKTNLGVEAKEHILGLKEYIAMAEKDRIEYLQSPEGVKQFKDPSSKQTQIHLFETLLPYAVVFGLEKQWVKQFQHLYAQPPDWYSGARVFTAVNLSRSIGSLSTTSRAAFSPPSSSGGSGFGGGGSGGGGGGGGGGGW